MENKDILKKLENLLGQNNLKDYVINYIIDDRQSDEDIKLFFKDFFYGGCQSGYVASLIYYADTNQFFNKYEGEIQELVEEWQESTGEGLKINGLISHFFSWFGFEEMARKICDEIGLEF
jgi:hypothetical protein